MGLVHVDASNSSVGKITVQKDGATVGVQTKINFNTGTNQVLTVDNDTSNQRINVTIDASGGGAGGAADALQTTGADVDVSAAAPPTGLGQVLTSTNATHATWQDIGAASGVRSATTSVLTTGATAPTSGQVLTATSAATATWQTPSNVASFLADATGSINVAAATAPVTGQVLTATGTTTATWQTPSSASATTVTINGASLTNPLAADLDDATPTAPANSLNVRFQKDTSSPTNVSANILMTDITKVGTVTAGVWNGTDVAVADGGTGLSAGTSGGVPYFSGATTIASSGALAVDRVVMGGGAGAAPTSLAAGTNNTFLKGVTGAAPTWSAVDLATAQVTGVLPVANYATGTPTGSKFVRDDGQLAVPAGGGDVVGPAVVVASEMALWDGTTGDLLKSATGTGFVKVVSGVYQAPVATVSLTTEVLGTLPGANGGTGSTRVTFTGPGSARTYTLPDADATILTTNAAVSYAQGGTATTSAQAAINGLMAASGALAQGDVFYYNGTNVVRLAPGTSGHFLKTNGAAANPAWASASAGSASTLSKSIAIPSPSNSENISIFFTPVALTITKIVSVIQGNTGQSVTWNICKTTNRDDTAADAGETVFSSNQVTTSTTSGDTLTSFTSAAISANTFVWFKTSAVAGVVNEFSLTMVYTEP